MRRLALTAALLLPQLAAAGTNATLWITSGQTNGIGGSYDLVSTGAPADGNSGAFSCLAGPTVYRTYYSTATATGSATITNGTWTATLVGDESNAACNDGYTAAFYKRTGTTDTLICTATSGEYGTSNDAITATCTGSATIASGDRIRVTWSTVQVGTAGTTRNLTLFWGATNPSRIVLPQCVPGITDDCVAGVTVSGLTEGGLDAAATVTAGSAPAGVTVTGATEGGLDATATVTVGAPSVNASFVGLTENAALTLQDAPSSAFNLTAGQLVIVATAAGSNNGAISSVTDTAGNTYYHAITSVDVTYDTEIWYSNTTAGNASNVVTVHYGGAGAYYSFLIVARYTLPDGYTAAPDGGNSGSSTSPITTGSFSPASAHDLIVAYLMTWNAAQTTEAMTGYVERTTQASNLYQAFFDKLDGASGAQTATATYGTASSGVLTAQAFKLEASGPAPVTLAGSTEGGLAATVTVTAGSAPSPVTVSGSTEGGLAASATISTTPPSPRTVSGSTAGGLAASATVTAGAAPTPVHPTGSTTGGIAASVTVTAGAAPSPVTVTGSTAGGLSASATLAVGGAAVTVTGSTSGGLSASATTSVTNPTPVTVTGATSGGVSAAATVTAQGPSPVAVSGSTAGGLSASATVTAGAAPSPVTVGGATAGGFSASATITTVLPGVVTGATSGGISASATATTVAPSPRTVSGATSGGFSATATLTTSGGGSAMISGTTSGGLSASATVATRVPGPVTTSAASSGGILASATVTIGQSLTATTEGGVGASATLTVVAPGPAEIGAAGALTVGASVTLTVTTSEVTENAPRLLLRTLRPALEIDTLRPVELLRTERPTLRLRTR